MQLLGTFYVIPLTLTGKSFHLVIMLPIKHSNSKLHGAVLCCAELLALALQCIMLMWYMAV